VSRPRPINPRSLHHQAGRALACLRVLAAAGSAALAVTAVAVVMLAAPEAASAGTGDPVVLAAKDLPAVIHSLQAWIMGILAAVATLYLVLAGVYYATAGGDPTQVERAKAALKSALVGYALAVLAPVLLQVVRGIVGG